MKRDTLVEEVRDARREISQECDHDIWKLYAHYESLQNLMKTNPNRRFVSQPPVGSVHETSTVESG